MDDAISPDDIDSKVYEALRKAGGTLDHLAKTAGLSKRLTDESLKRLVGAGRVERRWVLISRGAHDWKFYAAEPPGSQHP